MNQLAYVGVCNIAIRMNFESSLHDHWQNLSILIMIDYGDRVEVNTLVFNVTPLMVKFHRRLWLLTCKVMKHIFFN